MLSESLPAAFLLSDRDAVHLESASPAWHNLRAGTDVNFYRYFWLIQHASKENHPT